MTNIYHLFLTEYCNFNCSYCYEKCKSSKEITEDKFIEILNKYIVNDNTQLCFFGGEIFTISVDKLTFFFEEVKKHSIKNNINVKIRIITNGTNLEKKEYRNLILKYRDLIYEFIISLDGIYKSNLNRRLTKKQFDNIVNTYKWARINELPMNSFTLLVCKNNIQYLFENIKFIFEILAFDKIIIKFENYAKIEGEYTNKDLIELSNQLKKIYSYINEKKGILKVYPIEFIKEGKIRDINYKPCHSKYIKSNYIDINGKLYTCLEGYLQKLNYNNNFRNISLMEYCKGNERCLTCECRILCDKCVLRPFDDYLCNVYESFFKTIKECIVNEY